MGTVVKIAKTNTAQQTLKALSKLSKKKSASKTKTLASFYGKMQGAFGDALAYQKKIRNEWE
jgi:hypothetical protein